MAKTFKDFTFANHKLSEYGNYMAIDFEGDSEIPLGLERDMEMGETNKYKIEPNYLGSKWTSTLPLELHIIKDVCKYNNQKEMQFSQDEIRKITRWLTSPHYPQWINFEYAPDEMNENKISDYKGWFNNIETFVVGGAIYGLKLYFTCSTPFGYTSKKSVEILGSTSTIVPQIIENNNDELEDYCYPEIKIYPNSTGECFICNLSDAKILDSNLLNDASLQDIVEQYATSNWYTVRYAGENLASPTYICDNNAIQFYLIDKYANETKCTIFYEADSGYYYIVENGFLYMKVQSDLEINMDCQRLLIQDSIGRMVTYEDLGISDVDHMYWLRLINGGNSILIYGDIDVTFLFRESRKVGE